MMQVISRAYLLTRRHKREERMNVVSLQQKDRNILYECGIHLRRQTPWLLVRKYTIPTERPPLVGKISTNYCG
jgi:hypothetical protein